MVTLGVDLAAKPKKTAACLMRWEECVGTVVELKCGVTDDRLLELAERADKIGIDVPFGWPEVFVEAVNAHHNGRPWPAMESSEELRFRKTDSFVKDKTQKRPLSVSTEKLGIVAFRMACLMKRLASNGETVDRSGKGKYVEVYPAAALIRWGFETSKKQTPAIVSSFLKSVGSSLKLEPDVRTLCQRSRDAFDALIASLVARAAALGLCESIPERHLLSARTEGWIALPQQGSLPKLLGQDSISKTP